MITRWEENRRGMVFSERSRWARSDTQNDRPTNKLNSIFAPQDTVESSSIQL